MRDRGRNESEGCAGITWISSSRVNSISLVEVRRTESRQSSVIRVSASRWFFVFLAATAASGGVVFGLIPSPDSFFLRFSIGFVVTIFALSVVGGFGVGLGWVKIGPEGLSGLTSLGRRLVSWQEVRFVEWIPAQPGRADFGWGRPALAAYAQRPSGSQSTRNDRLIFVRLRFIVTRQQEVRVARELLEACRKFGSSTSVKHGPALGTVGEARWAAMWEEIDSEARRDAIWKEIETLNSEGDALT